jgi:alpha-ketoglutarate-dependent taurine dioxygenase
MSLKYSVVEYNNTDDINVLNSTVSSVLRELKNKNSIVIVRNCCTDKEISDENIDKLYLHINGNLGNLVPVDIDLQTYKPTMKYTTDVKFNYDSDEKRHWKSSNFQNIHTDNTFGDSFFYANITTLYCLKPCEYSGETTVITNNDVLRYIEIEDRGRNKNLLHKLYDTSISYLAYDNKYIVKPIIYSYTDENNTTQPIINFNVNPAKRGNNSKEVEDIIDEFHDFLDKKISRSSLMTSFKLQRGDAIYFNDETVMHARNSFIGSRHYKKMGILIPEISHFPYQNLQYISSS